MLSTLSLHDALPISRRPLRDVGQIDLDLLVEDRADIHHPIDHLWPARKVILLFHGVWLDSRLKVFRQIPPPTGHPASRFNAAGRDVMVGVLLVMSPRVVTDDRVHFHQPEDEDQPVAQLGRSDGVEFVIAVMQVEDFLQAETARDLEVIALVVEDDLPYSRPASGHLIIARANQDTCVAFADQLEDGPTCEQRQIIAVWLDGGEYLALVGPSLYVALDEHFSLLSIVAHLCLRGGAGDAQSSAAGDGSTNESSPVHADLLSSAQMFDDISHSLRAHRAINAGRHAGGASDVKFTDVRRGANRLNSRVAFGFGAGRRAPDRTETRPEAGTPPAVGRLPCRAI